MNKKTLAIAALALFATTGLASARTIHATPHIRTSQASPFDARAEYQGNAVRSWTAETHRGAGAENQIFDHPGDNDMDPYINNN
jgi:hypothetical protein